MLRNYIVGLATVVLIPHSLLKKRYPRVACPLTLFFSLSDSKTIILDTAFCPLSKKPRRLINAKGVASSVWVRTSFHCDEYAGLTKL